MKNLKFLIVIGLLVIVISVAYLKLNNAYNIQKDISDNKIHLTNWKDKAPQLFTNSGYSKLMTSMPTNNRLAESVAKLEGKITNPFGVRDDILEFILKNVPNDDPRIMKASIEKAQLNQSIYYDDISAKDALKLANKDSLLTTCLRIYTTNYSIENGIDKLMRNTKARNAHMWEVDRKYFSWKIVGSGLSVADENKACEKGDF